MTIRQFAALCDCNPQTLRYYDHVDLLKPVQVDPWSGYRYYDEDQALTFVKIKILQAAGFSIEEIRELLDKDNLTIARAFDEKIAEQEAKLQKAQCMLLGSTLPIVEITQDCGFSSHRYFHECFLRQYSCTPGEYRKRFQASNPSRK